MESIENGDKTLLISTREDIENYIQDITRLEIEVPFSTLEDALKIFDAMGCGYQQIKIVAYYSLAAKGIFLIAKNGNIGIELKEKEIDPEIELKEYKKKERS